jgi:hypothetical protein
MFDAAGRVLGAQRSSEQFLMGDLDHAGWPRHLDRMLIHWDKERWTDPTLLATHLRLPATISDPNPRDPGIALEPTPTSTAPEDRSSSVVPARRRLLLFTNAGCLGCQVTKRLVNQSPRLHEAMKMWDYELVDTATDDGASLAARYRVTVVPVLIGYDGSHEVLRTENIQTEDEIAHALAQASEPQ